jgi:hypothetical protein
MEVLAVSLFQRGRFSKACCGYSTPARNGTCCCRSVIRTTKPFIGVFRVGAETRFCVGFSWISPTSFAGAAHWMKKSASSMHPFAMAKGGGAEIGATKRGKGLKIMAIVDRRGLPLSVRTHVANHQFAVRWGTGAVPDLAAGPVSSFSP